MSRYAKPRPGAGRLEHLLTGLMPETGWDGEHFEYVCRDGTHPSFWKTVIQSDEWKAWEKEGYKLGWDVDESRECNWFSAGHFAAFLKFTVERARAVKAGVRKAG